MNPLWSNIFRKKHEEESLAFFLGLNPIFSDLSNRELSYLETRVHSRAYDSHETVFAEGDPGSGIYIIRSGLVKIFSRDRKGRIEDLALLGPGDFFGETTLSAPSKRTASAKTLERSELIGLFRADLLDAVQKHPALANKFLVGLSRVLSERLQTSEMELRQKKKALADLESAAAEGPQST